MCASPNSESDSWHEAGQAEACQCAGKRYPWCPPQYCRLITNVNKGFIAKCNPYSVDRIADDRFVSTEGDCLNIVSISPIARHCGRLQQAERRKVWPAVAPGLFHCGH